MGTAASHHQRQYDLPKGALVALHDKGPLSNIVESVHRKQVPPTVHEEPGQVLPTDFEFGDSEPVSPTVDVDPEGTLTDVSDSDQGTSRDFLDCVNLVQPHYHLTTCKTEDKMKAKERKKFSTHIVNIINSYRGPERCVKAALESESLDDLQLESLGHLLKRNPDHYKLWHRRKMLIGCRIDATCISSELQFTEEILSMHPKNKHCWSYRQWFLEAFQGGLNEIEFSEVVLEGHTGNEFAWIERFFVVTKLNMRSVDAEADYTVKIIREEPDNEHPWIYLRSLYKEVGFDSQKLDRLFEFVFDDSGTKWGPRSEQAVRQGSIRPISVEINIVVNRRKYTNALDTILDLICGGYKATKKVDDLIRSISPSHSPFRLLDNIYSILSIASPLGKHRYWKWRIDQVRPLVC